MNAILILSCAATVALAQHGNLPLKELDHFRAITEPHLPRDPNVLLATQNFLTQFAELKALADAAPDPLPRVRNNFAPIQGSGAHRFATQHTSHQGRVAHPSPAPSPPPTRAPAPPSHTFRPQSGAQFNVHDQIRTLLNRHQPPSPSFSSHSFNPSPAPAPAPTHFAPSPAPSFRPAQPIPVRFPNFSVLSSVGGHQRATVPTSGGHVHPTGFTPEVLAAQKNLAAAHQNILRQQASLSPRIF